MKKVLSLFATMIFSYLSWGQFEVTFDNNTTDISGTVHVINDVPIASLTHVYFKFHNLSGADIPVTICRTQLDVPVEFTDDLCWGSESGGSTCYNVYGYNWCSDSDIIPTGERGRLSIEITPFVAGSGLYRYYFKNGTIALDSIDVLINTQAEPIPETNDVLLYGGGPNDLGGTVYEVNNVAIGSVVHPIFKFVNTCEINKFMTITRYKINGPNEFEDEFSWDFPSFFNPSNSTGDYDNNVMQTNPWCANFYFSINLNEEGYLSVFIRPNVAGSALYRYYFKRNNDTYIDSIDVQINTIGSSASINESTATFDLTAYPNPASSELVVNTTGIIGRHVITVKDVLGKIVYENNSDETMDKIDVSNLNNGVYILSVAQNGVIIQNKPVIVKH